MLKAEQGGHQGRPALLVPAIPDAASAAGIQMERHAGR